MNNFDLSKIKWACIQPLTGGMYIGALQAIGHDAEWIMSYEGLDWIKYKEDGSVFNSGNEYNLLKWLSNNNHSVPYYKIKDRQMFNPNIKDTDITVYLGDEEKLPNYENLDLVVAVPVCAGLSMVSTAKEDVRDTRNCNMQWLAYYTLNVIKPKIYCFENAPTLMTSRGEGVRKSLEKMAEDAGYSILYYKTDTVLHHNCQRRPRTFVIFMKWQGEGIQTPDKFEFEKATILIPEFFDAISKDAPQNEPIKSFPHNYAAVDFMKYKYGKNWTNEVYFNLISDILWKQQTDEFKQFIIHNENYSEPFKDKAIEYIDHITYKLSLGLNYYGRDACLFKETFPSVQFKSMPIMLHYTGERFCTIREYLSLMGMPEDFIIYCDVNSLPKLSKIGQNVPVGTAKFIVSQLINTLLSWDSLQRDHSYNVLYQDNIKGINTNYHGVM